MKNSKMILDCTLRDGGYINNWDFGKENIQNIIDSLVCSGIDIVEIGFLTNMLHDENKSLFSNKQELEFLKSIKGQSLIAGMIALGEKEIHPSLLPNSQETGVDIIRITFHNEEKELDKAFEYANLLISNGYKVCMQPIGTTFYTNEELLELIAKINKLNPYALYLVDTLGTMLNKDLLKLTKTADEHLNTNIKLGFHSHNNLQMAYSNAQCLVNYETSRDVIIDASLYGMGRGAGNLCTELITSFYNENIESKYNMFSLLEAIDRYILPLSQKYSWGYNMHYCLAARYNCHPNYATFLMNKQTLNINQVSFLLQNLPTETRHVYSKASIEKLYDDFQNKNIQDNDDMLKIHTSIQSREILILAPGYSLKEYESQIKNFIEKQNPVVFSVNTLYEKYNSDYIFISNWKRLSNLLSKKNSSKIIATSNLPKLFEDCLFVDYGKLCDHSFEEPDNAGVMLLRLLKSLGVKKIYMAGFDGFDGKNANNFYSENFSYMLQDDVAKNRNDNISKQLKLLENDMELVFITPTLYKKGNQ